MEEQQFIKMVGQAIARQRKKAGLTQAEVSEKLGVEKESISRMETGAISPSLSRLHQLACIFECSERQFFWFEDAAPTVQADTIVDMIQSLPHDRRSQVVRFVADAVRMLS